MIRDVSEIEEMDHKQLVAEVEKAHKELQTLDPSYKYTSSYKEMEEYLQQQKLFQTAGNLMEEVTRIVRETKDAGKPADHQQLQAYKTELLTLQTQFKQINPEAGEPLAPLGIGGSEQEDFNDKFVVSMYYLKAKILGKMIDEILDGKS